MSYSQLSISERNQLFTLRSTTDLSLRAIAEKLGRSQSTISRELTRNQNGSGIYLPDSAQQKMEDRRKQSKIAFSGVTEVIFHEVKRQLEQYHSPEQIAGRMNYEGKGLISHETI